MLAARLIEVVADAGQCLDNGLIFGNFAVEDAQRICDRAALAIGIHSVFYWSERLAEGLVVSAAIRGTADGIELKGPASDAEPVKQRRQHFENFRISRRRFTARGCRADDLGSDLIELAIASLLRALAAELRSDVVELVQSALGEIVLDVCADDAGRVFGAEGERLPLVALGAALILPGVHFLGNNVCLFADSAREQLRIFKNGRADFMEVMGAKNVTRRGLDEVPERRIRRQQISRSSNGFDHQVLASSKTVKKTSA